MNDLNSKKQIVTSSIKQQTKKKQARQSIKVCNNPKTKSPYNHQIKALNKLNEFYIVEGKSKGILVLPTAAGKTYTAVSWLLKNVINENGKVLWIAHRHFLLDEALDNFRSICNKQNLPKKDRLIINIISGATYHNNPSNICGDEDVLIVGKDCLLNGLESFNKFLDANKDIFIVIDEAHHAVTKTYLSILEHIENKAHSVRIMGLTATPFRTATKERTWLSKVFSDGLIHSEDLFDLVDQGLIATPRFESLNMDDLFKSFKTQLSNAVSTVEENPEQEKAIFRHIMNHLIVKAYDKKKHGKSIIFATDQNHAKELKELFTSANHRAEFLISDSNAGENKRKSNDFKKNNIDILINVNILSEGANFPDVRTIFIAKPTKSKIAFNQMVGRGLRGVKAGGTIEANIVCFNNALEDLVAWTSPKELTNESVSKINRTDKSITVLGSAESADQCFTRQFDKTLCNMVKIDFGLLQTMEKYPVGWYLIDIEKNHDENKFSIQTHKIIVYQSQKKIYEELERWIPILWEGLMYYCTNIDQDKINFIKRKIHENVTGDISNNAPLIRPADVDIYIDYFCAHNSFPEFHPLGNGMNVPAVTELQNGITLN